ncbi:glycosyltransferase family 8 protein [uncultured Enterovirga sp.]|uniref:glycosyltransferase family 8 protein n=1 Tax=uncultured Enterovirga sp. TaxID=2026352 RepID=UPI0035C9821C
MSEPRLRLLFCVNNGYLPQAAVALSSVLETAPGARVAATVAAFQRSPSLSDEVFAPILARYPGCTVQYCDLNHRIVAGLPATARFPREIYTRILLGRFMEAGCERVLYLDADVLALADLRPLFQASLGGATIGAVRDHFRLDPQAIGFSEGEPYFNSGVMLFDLRAWRERRAEARVLEILARQGESLPWLDQDALNIALRGEVCFLDLGWNFQPRCADVPAGFLGLSEPEYRALRAHPQLVHFTTSLKPWNAPGRIHYSDRFFAAVARAGLAQRFPRPWTRSPSALIAGAKTRLRWAFPRAFRAARSLLRPRAAALMYRSRAQT